MLSLSDNEFSVIGFLTRNFSEKLTIRSMAQRLGFSAAGVFNILKKLEKENIVIGQKLLDPAIQTVTGPAVLCRPRLACKPVLNGEPMLRDTAVDMIPRQRRVIIHSLFRGTLSPEPTCRIIV